MINNTVYLFDKNLSWGNYKSPKVSLFIQMSISINWLMLTLLTPQIAHSTYHVLIFT